MNTGGHSERHIAAKERHTGAATVLLRSFLAAPEIWAHMQKRIVTIKEACSALGCSRGTVYKLINDGKIDRVKLGASTRITVASIDKFTKHDGAAA